MTRRIHFNDTVSVKIFFKNDPPQAISLSINPSIPFHQWLLNHQMKVPLKGRAEIWLARGAAFIALLKGVMYLVVIKISCIFHSLFKNSEKAKNSLQDFQNYTNSIKLSILAIRSPNRAKATLS